MARWGAGGADLCVQSALQNWRKEEEGKGHAMLLALRAVRWLPVPVR